MKSIPLHGPNGKGNSVIIDDTFFEYFNQWKWSARKYGRNLYAGRTVNIGKYRSLFLKMHNLMFPIPSGGFVVDHINHNTLDNRRENLRICHIQQNIWNSPLRKKGNSSGLKGVCWDKDRNLWLAQICKDGKNYYIGRFQDKFQAKEAYDIASKEKFGEFACN